MPFYISLLLLLLLLKVKFPSADICEGLLVLRSKGSN